MSLVSFMKHYLYFILPMGTVLSPNDFLVVGSLIFHLLEGKEGFSVCVRVCQFILDINWSSLTLIECNASSYFRYIFKLWSQRVFPAENRLNCHHGPTTLPPSSYVLLDAQQQAPNLKNAGWQARLFVSKEGRQNPQMRRHRRQVAGMTKTGGCQHYTWSLSINLLIYLFKTICMTLRVLSLRDPQLWRTCPRDTSEFPGLTEEICAPLRLEKGMDATRVCFWRIWIESET